MKQTESPPCLRSFYSDFWSNGGKSDTKKLKPCKLTPQQENNDSRTVGFSWDVNRVD